MTDLPYSPAPLLLVTGASGGVATAVRQRAVQLGWRVAAVSRGPIEYLAAGEFGITADVSTADGARQAMEAAQTHFGEAPSRLCLAAGNVRLGAIERMAEEPWRQVLAGNLDTAWYTLQAWSRSRGDLSGGAAVLFSSAAAATGTPNHAAVAAAKGGLEALVRALAADWAPRGRRINALALGLTDTPMTAAFTRGDRARQAVTAQYPLQRIGQPDEVADWTMRLLDDSSWMTGQILPLDGGFSAIRPLVKTG